MSERTVNISNFIGTYDNYISDADCNKAIELFEQQNKFKNTINRLAFEQAPITQKQDQQFFAAANNINVWWEELKPMILNFDQALKHYQDNTGIKTCYSELYYTDLKIQKTLPTEGYHVWHIEHDRGFANEPRVLVFSIYLNDVAEGGETEFLHFSKRVKSTKGRICIFPAGFPYLHRGNPPLSGEKYILTSWLLCR
jgi:hypothetical protein